MENTTNEQERMFRDGQYRKSRSIAFFSSTNAAIELLKTVDIEKRETYQEGRKPYETLDSLRQEIIVKWRDWFLAEYDRDYQTNVATIGNSVTPAVKDGLDKAKRAYEG